jgi:CMP-N-acetylneuraminic acid synthetase
VSTSEFPSFIEKGFKINKGRVKLVEKKYKNKNSNNLSPTYYDAGQFLWGKSAAFKSKKEIFSKHTSTYLLNSPKYIDLNTNDDWKKILLYSKIFK